MKMVTIQAEEGSYILTPKEYNAIKKIFTPENGELKSNRELAEEIYNNCIKSLSKDGFIDQKNIETILNKYR